MTALSVVEAFGSNRPAVRVVVYCRISSDPREKRAGVGRQESECRELCSLLSRTTGEDWIVTRVVVDNDRSNSIARKRERERFGELLDQMETGSTGADAIVFFDQDRFVKDPIEWARWITAAQRHPMRVAIVGSGEVDVTSPDGFMMSGFRMMSSTTDTMRQVKRIRSFTAAQRKTGKLGGRVLYGWRRVIVNDAQGYKVDWRDELHVEHSAIVRELARRVLSGESGTAIASDLNERGVPTASRRWAALGSDVTQWTPSAIRRLLERPANIAVRIDSDGAEHKLAMPPILTRTEYKRLQALYGDPTRKTTTDNRVKHLLSGLARCGVCGQSVRRMIIPSNQRNRPTPWTGYTCKSGGHVGIVQGVADEVVVSTLIDTLTDADLSDLYHVDDSAAETLGAQIDELQAELDSYVADAKRKLGDPLRVSKSELDGHKLALVPDIDRLRSRRASLTTLRGVELARAVQQADDKREAFDRLALTQRRELIASLFDVEIMRSTPGQGRRRDVSRVRVTLR